MEEIYFIYQKALEKLKFKFDCLLEEFSSFHDNNPIEHVKYRIKKMDSIEGKLTKKGKEFTLENIQSLNDIVGVRVVCSFLSDAYEMIEWVRRDKDIRIISTKDYIHCPKENGYRSYHFNIEIPILYLGKEIYVKAEIQIRTIAMDMWASLEHKIWYKKGITLPKEIAQEIDSANQLCGHVDTYLDELASQRKEKSKKEVVQIPLFQEKVYEIEKMKYQYAMESVQQIISSLSESYNVQNVMNPIEHISSRLKSDEAIYLKMSRFTKDFTVDTMNQYVTEVAGVRVVCSFLSDLEEIVHLFKGDLEEDKGIGKLGIQIVEEKDYVTNPKKSGYRAYHFLLNVPLFLNHGLEYVKVEVQIRTIAMDMWASLEHKLCYHKEVDEAVSNKLLSLADTIMTIDDRMDSNIKKSRELIKMKKKD